jgi:hypothetical protein
MQYIFKYASKYNLHIIYIQIVYITSNIWVHFSMYPYNNEYNTFNTQLWTPYA